MALYITEEQYNSGANTLEAKGLMALSSVISLLRCSNDEGGCAILVGLMVHLFFPTQGVGRRLDNQRSQDNRMRRR